jgi:glycosyltransferase involved in cell wall biosynthesis
LEAYALLPERLRATVRLQLAGSGSPAPAFWRRVEELGLSEKVSHVLRPSLPELVALYRSAAVFALPSDEEGLGLVVLEAMACGVPVVATRCGGPEGIIDDGLDGYLVPRDAELAMADRIRQLLEDDDRNDRMGQLARGKIAAKYAANVTGDVFIDMWDRLLR